MSTPNKFWFHHESDESRVYFASRDGDNYVVTGGNLKDVMYSNSDVESYLSWGDWIMVEADTAKENPSVKKLISINVNSVRAAAEFDVANNKHTSKKNLSVEEIEQEIIKYVREMYSGLIYGYFEWEQRGIRCRSYSVQFRPEDENYGVISVEVDPSVGMPSFYASVEDFLNQN